MIFPWSTGALQATNAQLDVEAADLRQQAGVLREGIAAQQARAASLRVGLAHPCVDVVVCIGAQQGAQA